MLLIIDNYDSFTYNLYQQIKRLIESENHQINVIRNDSIGVKEILELNPKGIIISPGPGSPDDTEISKALIKTIELNKKHRIPIL